MWAQGVFRFVTICTFDRQTDDERAERPRQYRALHYTQLHGKDVQFGVQISWRTHFRIFLLRFGLIFFVLVYHAFNIFFI